MMTKKQICQADTAARLIEAYPSGQFADPTHGRTFSMFPAMSDREKAWAYSFLVRFTSSFEEMMVILIYLDAPTPAELETCFQRALALAGSSRDCKTDAVEAMEVFHEEDCY